MVKPKTKEEIDLMRQSGKITAQALKKALESSKIGVSLLEIDEIADQEIKRLGGKSNFKMVSGYHFATCLTLNDEVVHGIPRDIKLKVGDLLSIDVGAEFMGWNSDAAWSIIIGEEKSGEKLKFLQIGEQALWEAIKEAKEGNFIGDISHTIQTLVEGQGYSIVRSMVGHGIGRNMHEEPEIPGYGKKGLGLKLLTGMTLAIEVIYTAGSHQVVLLDDGWTIASADHSLGGLFEMSVVVGKKGGEALTDWRKI